MILTALHRPVFLNSSWEFGENSVFGTQTKVLYIICCHVDVFTTNSWPNYNAKANAYYTYIAAAP